MMRSVFSSLIALACLWLVTTGITLVAHAGDGVSPATLQRLKDMQEMESSFRASKNIKGANRVRQEIDRLLNEFDLREDGTPKPAAEIKAKRAAAAPAGPSAAVDPVVYEKAYVFAKTPAEKGGLGVTDDALAQVWASATAYTTPRDQWEPWVELYKKGVAFALRDISKDGMGMDSKQAALWAVEKTTLLKTPESLNAWIERYKTAFKFTREYHYDINPLLMSRENQLKVWSRWAQSKADKLGSAGWLYWLEGFNDLTEFAQKDVKEGGLGSDAFGAKRWAITKVDSRLETPEDMRAWLKRYAIAFKFGQKNLARTDSKSGGFGPYDLARWAELMADARDPAALNIWFDRYKAAMNFAQKPVKSGGMGKTPADARAWAFGAVTSKSAQDLDAWMERYRTYVQFAQTDVSRGGMGYHEGLVQSGAEQWADRKDALSWIDRYQKLVKFAQRPYKNGGLGKTEAEARSWAIDNAYGLNDSGVESYLRNFQKSWHTTNKPSTYRCAVIWLKQAAGL